MAKAVFAFFHTLLTNKKPMQIINLHGFHLKIVTATGFKPVTPTSVVWYSIQLSYAAIALFCECKDSAIFGFYK